MAPATKSRDVGRCHGSLELPAPAFAASAAYAAAVTAFFPATAAVTATAFKQLPLPAAVVVAAAAAALVAAAVAVTVMPCPTLLLRLLPDYVVDDLVPFFFSIAAGKSTLESDSICGNCWKQILDYN